VSGEPLRDVWRRWGAVGIAGLAWSRTLGRIADLTLVVEWELPAAGRPPAPVAGFRYARPAVAPTSREAVEAAALLRVPVGERLGQDLFVAMDERGAVVACTWNDRPDAGAAQQRGIAVAPQCRGRGLAGSLLLFQAASLADEGVAVVRYRTALWNRASRRMFEKIGARPYRSRAVFRLLGRRVAVTGVPAFADRWIRRPSHC
jgi:ribosomal protein S18 acetylase RimI-like enzyme